MRIFTELGKFICLPSFGYFALSYRCFTCGAIVIRRRDALVPAPRRLKGDALGGLLRTPPQEQGYSLETIQVFSTGKADNATVVAS